MWVVSKRDGIVLSQGSHPLQGKVSGDIGPYFLVMHKKTKTKKKNILLHVIVLVISNICIV